jgi:hypothetical protein
MRTYLIVNGGLDLPIDVFALTIRGGPTAGVKDLAGNWLDGDGNGTPGGDATIQFRVSDPNCGPDSDADGVGDTCDQCPNTISGIWVANDGCPPAFPPDLDRDGDVDGQDVALFQVCVTGATTGPLKPGCEAADFDHDADVDQADFGWLQRYFSGGGNG